jgi:CBS-domain-containing membrane protein
VVDEDNKLLGVFTRRDLLDWARVKVGINSDVGKLWLAEETRLLKIIMSFTAGDLISPESSRAWVGLKDSLSQALQLMVDLDLICLPVLDDDEQIIGDLKFMDILACVVQE